MAMNITLADLTACEDGTVLVAKDAVDGSRRHISQVANGLRCGCVCYGCGRTLVARNGGDQNRHHFAHQPDEVTANCATAGETALHILGKEIIEKHRRVTLPAVTTPGIDGKPVDVTPEVSIDLLNVRLETAAGELIPDIIATMPDGRQIFIEIANTHPCSLEKISKLATMGVEVLEINVRGYRNTSLGDLDDIILDLAPRVMLHSSERAARAAEIAGQRRRIEEKERREAERLVAVYREPPSASHRKAAELVEEMTLWDLEDLMDANDDTVPSAFVVPRRQWQAAVFYRLMDTQYPETVSPIDMVNRFKEREWTKRDLVYVTNEQTRKIAADHADFRSAYEEILVYMRRLAKADIVYQKAGKSFYMTHDFKTKLKANLEALNEADANRLAIHEAYEAVEALVKPGGGQMPDFEVWLQQHADQLGVEVQKFLSNEDLVYQTEESLKEISRVIENRAGGEWEELPRDLMGLPMVGLVNRLMQTWENARAGECDDWRTEIKTSNR